MEQIRQILNALCEEDRKLLIYSHQNEMTQYIALACGTFIGVHCAHLPHLNPTHQYNDWCVGSIINQSERNGQLYKEPEHV